jgi:predicted GNAT superfamily acetyltransferase
MNDPDPSDPDPSDPDPSHPELHSVSAAELAATAARFDAMLALNNAHATELSWLEPARLAHLIEHAFLVRRIGDLDGFLIAFDQDAVYDSPNFLWFRARYPRFVYVDRIVITAKARGRGYARRLYQDLFGHALDAGHDRVGCEVNLRPPNPLSDGFHAALGFAEVGQASVYADSRTVRYLSRTLSAPASA